MGMLWSWSTGCGTRWFSGAGSVSLQPHKLGVITEQGPGADCGCGASSFTQEGTDPSAAIGCCCGFSY